jgi:glutamate synthase domain-containing protein 2
LRQLIHDLRSVNPDAKISVKIAANYGVGAVAVGIAKCFTPKKYGDKIGIIIAGPGMFYIKFLTL